jgi:hypothetical protein
MRTRGGFGTGVAHTRKESLTHTSVHVLLLYRGTAETLRVTLRILKHVMRKLKVWVAIHAKRRYNTDITALQPEAPVLIS